MHRSVATASLSRSANAIAYDQLSGLKSIEVNKTEWIHSRGNTHNENAIGLRTCIPCTLYKHHQYQHIGCDGKRPNISASWTWAHSQMQREWILVCLSRSHIPSCTKQKQNRNRDENKWVFVSVQNWRMWEYVPMLYVQAINSLGAFALYSELNMLPIIHTFIVQIPTHSLTRSHQRVWYRGWEPVPSYCAWKR